MESKVFELPCGLRLLFMPDALSVMHCGFVVDAGSRDELPYEEGLAHFVEHSLFMDTPKRTALSIISRMDRVGGELNAYTNKEETVVYVGSPAGYLERAVELLADIVFSPHRVATLIEHERGILIDEINAWEDSPSEVIFDEFDEILFPSCPLGRRILGTKQSLAGLTAEMLRCFHRRFYQPERMVFFIRGPYTAQQVLRVVQKHLPAQTTSRPVPVRAPAMPVTCAQHVERTLHTNQGHVVMGLPVPGLYDADATALTLLNNMLGGPGMNSRLNLALRERRGWVYGVESTLTTHTDVGQWNIYFGTDPHRVQACMDVAMKEVQQLRHRTVGGLTLHMAKKQLAGQLLMSESNPEQRALHAGHYLLRYNRPFSTAEAVGRIEQLTATQLREAALKHLDPEKFSTLTYR